MSGPLPRLRLVRDVAHRVRLGHPWIYREALDASVRRLGPGALVDVADRRGDFLARGYADPAGPIAVRVLELDAGRADPAGLVGARVAAACALRRLAAAAIDSDGVRLLHGEGDRLPGLVLDAYGTSGVVRFDGPAAAAFYRPLVPVVVEACRSAGFPFERLLGRAPEGRGGEAAALVGDLPAGPVLVREGAARYEVDLVRGQKTGFFLDQRGNRRLVGGLAAGAAVLNLFAYTGGFSVAAGLAGARQVTTVELARPAIAATARNLELNGLRRSAHELVTADVFEFLAAARASGRRWDIVVCDPPSFAPSERARARALAAYRRLNRDAAAVVSPGGLLATASCSSHVTLAELRAEVAAALGELGRPARLLDVRGAGPDHPVLPAFPEGDYLKFLLVALG